MDLGLSGRRAVVTGASRGIGEAIARELAREGATCFLVARDASRLDTVVDTINGEAGPRAHACAVDLSGPDGPDITIASALRVLGGIDLLINNAGATAGGSLSRLTDAEWQDGFALKFTGAMRLCRAAWPHLKASTGTVVNVVGITAHTPRSGLVLGGSVNAALLNFTKGLAELGTRDRVRVNAISPGHVLTDRVRSRLEAICREQSIPLGQATADMLKAVGATRFGEPAEIASAVAFLASDRASFVHGVELTVDGGATRVM